VIVDNLKSLVILPLIFGLAALGYSFTIPPSFTAKTQFLPPQQQSSSASLIASLSGLVGATSVGYKNPVDQYIAFLKSQSVKDALIERFNLLEKYQVKLKTDARVALAGKVQISYGKDGLISIEVYDNDPKFAANLANAYVQELQILLSRLALTEAQQRRMFYEKQLKLTKENLANAEVLLKTSGVNSSLLKLNPSSAIESVARLRASISVQEVKLGTMRNFLTEISPEIRQSLSELASLKMQLTKAEKEEPIALGGSDYLTKYREFKYHEAMFELFAKQLELAKMDESREGAIIQVLDFAEPPERKSKPDKTLIAIISSLASGFALLLFVLLRFVFSRATQNEVTRLKLKSLRSSCYRALGKNI